MRSNNKKQTYIIQCLLSSKDVFSRCASIIKGEYFEKNYERIVDFIITYYNNHSAIPKRRLIDTEFDIKFDKIKVTKDEITHVCTEIETFCKETAYMQALMMSLDDIKTGNLGAITERIGKVNEIALDYDLGVDLFENPNEYLSSQIEHNTPQSTGIASLDKHLGGGILRKQLSLFSANSGGGKSLMLNNIGENLAFDGLHVLYITLELPEDMVYIRSAAIWTDSNIKEWKSHIPEISAKLSKGADMGGSFRIKRMRQGTCANEIRAYLKQYELELDRVPDLLVLDYVDLMSPNAMTPTMDISAKDKASTEQLSAILHDYDMYGLSASQQNRDGINNSNPSQAVIAGGMTKVNTVDNYVSLYMDAGMTLSGKMMIYFLKTRSSDGVGKSEELSFNPKTLAITDIGIDSVFSIMPTSRKKQTVLENKLDISGLPCNTGEIVNNQTDLDYYVEQINEIEDKKADSVAVMPKPSKENNALLSLMSSINGDL